MFLHNFLPSNKRSQKDDLYKCNINKMLNRKIKENTFIIIVYSCKLLFLASNSVTRIIFLLFERKMIKFSMDFLDQE